MLYTLKDGSKVEAPDKPNAEQSAWLASEGAKADVAGAAPVVAPAPVEKPSLAEDVGKSIGSKFVEGAVRSPFIAADLFTLGKNQVKKMSGSKDAPESSISDGVISLLQDSPFFLSEEMKSGRKKLAGYTSQETADKFLPPKLESYLRDQGPIPLYKPKSTEARYAGAAAEGVGGGFLGGLNTLKFAPKMLESVLSRFVQSPAAQNAVIGSAGELGGDISRKFDTTQEQSPIAKVIAAIGTALAVGGGARLSAPRYPKLIHEATKDVTPAQWTAAQQANKDFAAAGAKTQTIPDTMPATSTLRGIAQEISNAPGGQALYAKLAGRDEGEISTLLNDAKTQMQRSAVPNVSPLPGTASVDDFLFKTARGNRSSALNAELSNAPLLPESSIAEIVASLRQRANRPVNKGTEDEMYSLGAAGKINSIPRYPIPQGSGASPTSGPGTLTGGPAAPQAPNGGVLGVPAPALPALPPPMPTGLPAPTTGTAVGPARPQIAQYPDAKGSNFRFPDNQPITDVIPPQGANLTALSKVVKGLETVDAQPMGPAGQVLKNQAAIGASANASALLKQKSPEYAAAMDQYAKLSPQVELTEILAKNKLKPIPDSAKSSLRTDNVREEIAALMAKIDPANAPMVTSKMRAADTLSKLRPEQGAANVEAQYGTTLAQKVLSPFSSTGRSTATSMRSGVNSQVAELLANPTPANYKILQELAKNNPSVRALLANFSNVGAANAASQSDRSPQ